MFGYSDCGFDEVSVRAAKEYMMAGWLERATVVSNLVLIERLEKLIELAEKV